MDGELVQGFFYLWVSAIFAALASLLIISVIPLLNGEDVDDYADLRKPFYMMFAAALLLPVAVPALLAVALGVIAKDALGVVSKWFLRWQSGG